MSFSIASIILNLAYAYVIVGAAVALFFVLFALDADPAAIGSYAFRPLLIPGLILLWPLMVARWAGWWRHPQDRASGGALHHFIAWVCMAVVVPALLVYAAIERRAKPMEPTTIQLSGPGATP